MFHNDGRARAVLVDGEAKVQKTSTLLDRSDVRLHLHKTLHLNDWDWQVVNTLVRERDSIYRAENAFVEASGRGNNWALGYYGPRGTGCNALVDRNGPRTVQPCTLVEAYRILRIGMAEDAAASAISSKLCDVLTCWRRGRTMEGLRRELEGCDMVGGCTVLHSLSGGSGSGVGSRLLEEVRDTIGSRTLLSISVLPFSAGEMPLQASSRLFPSCYALALRPLVV
jgi:hypothetical protein